jgi:hypothetical protein
VELPSVLTVLSGVALLKILQICDIIELTSLRALGRQSGQVWSCTGAGGNVVGTLLKMFEKLGYIEMRLMSQQAHSGDTGRMLAQALEESTKKSEDAVRRDLKHSWTQYKETRLLHGAEEAAAWEQWKVVAYENLSYYVNDHNFNEVTAGSGGTFPRPIYPRKGAQVLIDLANDQL